MAYESTSVPVSRSQEGIRKLIMSRKGGRVAFIHIVPQLAAVVAGSSIRMLGTGE
jgi:hypothetical protein